MMRQKVYPLAILLWSLSIASICMCGSLNHARWKGMEDKPQKCYLDSCGPPFSYQFIPNPPRLDTECFASVDFEVVYDFFKGFFNYDIQGPDHVHFSGKADAKPPRPYLKGEHFYRNFTYRLPDYIPPGIAFSGNFTLTNDVDQLLICGTFFCKFVPKEEHDALWPTW